MKSVAAYWARRVHGCTGDGSMGCENLMCLTKHRPMLGHKFTLAREFQERDTTGCVIVDSSRPAPSEERTWVLVTETAKH